MVAMTELFATATAVKAVSSHQYTAVFPDSWCIGTGKYPRRSGQTVNADRPLVPHGGYITAVFMRVASTHFGTTLRSQSQPHAIALHLEFLRRTQVGPAAFTVRDVKLGRQTSVIHITLTQAGREEVVGYLTHADMSSETGISFPTSWALHPPPPPIDLARLRRGDEPNWAEQTHMPFPKFRKATQRVRWHFPRAGQPGRGIADEWIALSSGERFTQESIGYVCDAWPQLVEPYRLGQDPYALDKGKGGKGQERAAEAPRPDGDQPAKLWYPTLLLNLDVKKALPAEGVEFLFTRVQAKRIQNGRVDLEVVIMDEGGDVVALSHHVALIVDAERNTAERRPAAEGNVQGKL